MPPLAGFPGVEMIGSTIKIAQQNFGEHYKAIRALVDDLHPDLVFPLRAGLRESARARQARDSRAQRNHIVHDHVLAESQPACRLPAS